MSNTTVHVPFHQVEELRRDIEILSQNHEREVDRKDAIVQVSRAERGRLDRLMRLRQKAPSPRCT